MKLDETYEAGLYPGETLTVTKVYSNGRMAVVSRKGQEGGILCSHDMFSEPHLCLAHQSKDQTQLMKKQEEFKW